MKASIIANRPGPNCDLTIRLKFPTLDRFRTECREQIFDGHYFIKSSRTKPLDTRIQFVFVIAENGPIEVWSWGIVNEIIGPEDAVARNTSPGLRIQLMDISPHRRSQIEKLFGLDEAVEMIKKQHNAEEQAVGYTQRTQSPRHEFAERAKSFIEFIEDKLYYELLGVVKDATTEQIRSAYRQRTKRYHPDQFYRQIPEELHEEVDRAFQKMTIAYQALRDKESRAVYDTKIGNYLNPAAQRAAMPHIRMQRRFAKAYGSIVDKRSPQVKALVEAADEAIIVESYKLAQSKLKLAQALDPLNHDIRKKLDEIKDLVPVEEED